MYSPCCYSGGLALRDAAVKNKEMLMFYCTRADRERSVFSAFGVERHGGEESSEDKWREEEERRVKEKTETKTEGRRASRRTRGGGRYRIRD